MNGNLEEKYYKSKSPKDTKALIILLINYVIIFKWENLYALQANKKFKLFLRINKFNLIYQNKT